MADPALVELIDRARGESTLHGIGLTDPHSVLEIIWPAFKREVAPWADLEYSQDVVPPRVLARLKEPPPGATPPDVLIVGNPAAFFKAGLSQAFDNPFASRYPAGWTDASGHWIPLYVQPIVVIYNQHYVSSLPRGWTELPTALEPGKLVFEEPWRMISTGPALAELESALGGAELPQFLRDLASAAPLLVADNERSVLEVGSGSRWLGLSIWNVARRVRVGSPVRYFFLEPTPCVPGFGMLARDGSSPNLARLFLAWMASPDGQRAYTATGRIPAIPDLDVPTALAHVLPAGITPRFGTGGWLSDPERWVNEYREVFSAGLAAAPAGKGG